MNRMFYHAKIQAIATVLPKETLILDTLSSMYGKSMVQKICRATAIEEIHVAPLGMTTADYCFHAAKMLFQETDIKPEMIDGIVLVTETPDYIIPHTSALLQNRLQIPSATVAFDINYGCAGYVYGLFQSFMLVESGYCQNVLLCVGDTESHLIHEKDRAARMVIGDAGTATVISAVDEASPATFSFFTNGGGAQYLMVPAGGSRIPCEPGKTDIIEYDEDGNGRTKENLYMNGMEVMQFTLHDVKNVIVKTLEQAMLSKEEIDLFAFHQANEFIVNNLAKQLKVDKYKVPFGARKTGNTSCASIPVMLSELYPGNNEDFHRVVACGFGTGLSCAAGVIDLSQTKILSTLQI